VAVACGSSNQGVSRLVTMPSGRGSVPATTSVGGSTTGSGSQTAPRSPGSGPTAASLPIVNSCNPKSVPTAIPVKVDTVGVSSMALHVPILEYHRIVPSAEAAGSLPGLVLAPSLFSQQMDALKAAGWHTGLIWAILSFMQINGEDVMQEQINRFLSAGAFGVVGASSNRQKFGNRVLRCYLQNGKRAIPVNPNVAEIDGQRCYASVKEIQPPVQGALIMTSKKATDQVVRDCADAGIANIWMYGGMAPGAAPLPLVFRAAVEPEAGAVGVENGKGPPTSPR